MKKNEPLRNYVFSILETNSTLSLKDIKQSILNKFGLDKYNEKCIQNLLYNLKKQGFIKLEGNYYSLITANDSKQDKDIITKYYREIIPTCLKTERMLKNPFENIADADLIDAKKLYLVNKKILQILNEELIV